MLVSGAQLDGVEAVHFELPDDGFNIPIFGNVIGDKSQPHEPISGRYSNIVSRFPQQRNCLWRKGFVLGAAAP